MGILTNILLVLAGAILTNGEPWPTFGHPRCKCLTKNINLPDGRPDANGNTIDPMTYGLGCAKHADRTLPSQCNNPGPACQDVLDVGNHGDISGMCIVVQCFRISHNLYARSPSNRPDTGLATVHWPCPDTENTA